MGRSAEGKGNRIYGDGGGCGETRSRWEISNSELNGGVILSIGSTPINATDFERHVCCCAICLFVRGD
jgi:hypothetical protein